ncbi:MAG TPA: hypothetical protein EYN01_02415 [Chromatiales bacterium]|jgi:integrase|nr:hypothetical protein [Chromatiales bacterium]
MIKAIEKTDLTESFQERGLRAKTASETDALEHVSELLGHANTQTTRSIYRRKPTTVSPLFKSKKS